MVPSPVSDIQLAISEREFPPKLLEAINSYSHDPTLLIEKLQIYLNQLFSPKRMSCSDLLPPKTFVDLRERVMQTKRVHLEKEKLTFKEALSFLGENNYTLVDEITCMALLNLCSASKEEIPGFGYVAMPFYVQSKAGEKLHHCCVYPTKAEIGGSYEYKKHELVLPHQELKTHFIELFVVTK